MSKYHFEKDPQRAQEIEQYAHPVPSREFVIQYLHEQGRPIAFSEMVADFCLDKDASKEAFQWRLNAMTRDGQLMKNRRGRYVLVHQLSLIKGRVLGHKEGFGFLIPDDGGEDLFLSPKQMSQVMHNDQVLVKTTAASRGKKECAIVEILVHANETLVGHFHQEHGVAFVVPVSKHIPRDIMIPADQTGKAQPGQFVLVRLITYPHKHRPPTAKVIEVLGDASQSGIEIEVALRANQLPYVWPKAVLDQIATYGDAVQIPKGYQDLRDLTFFTIDGEHAKDFDDALCCESLGPSQGWRLSVAIADVSHYVTPDTPLDTEALLRGNSIYFPRRVIPMLPEHLSNHLCSLQPHCDRLALVCTLHVDQSGAVHSQTFYPAVIQSKARLTYSGVSGMLKKNRAKKDDSMFHEIKTLHQLYKVLYAKRKARGALEFDTQEALIQFNAQGKIDGVQLAERTDAHRMIEEAMLLANTAAAQFLMDHQMPVPFRVHSGPDPEKLDNLRLFLGALGLQLPKKKNLTPKDYAKIVARIQSRPDKKLIETVLLRSLSRAVYHETPQQHFGLAYAAYCHFTSPIRRYPDLLVHRAIHHVIAGGRQDTYRYQHQDVAHCAQQCSMTERRADSASRDVIDWLKCQYMTDKLGQVYQGIVTGVVGFGLFIELVDVAIEGLVHISGLPGDYYDFDSVHHKLVGRKTGRCYRLSDPLSVKVAHVDIEQRRIDFDLVS